MTPRGSLAYTPVSRDALPGTLAGWLAAIPGTVRVAIDGPDCAGPDEFAQSLLDPLQALGRPSVHLRSRLFWRDASLRLEQGREDADAFAEWLDDDALRREVLDPINIHGRYLPSLRDPETNRSTRALPQVADASSVLMVSGALLLGRGLPFDRAIHLAMSPAARGRRTPANEAWTLPAFDGYDAVVDPVSRADVVIRLDDPRHPAMSELR